MSYSYDRQAGLHRFPEGTFTEKDWVEKHAERVEEYRTSWQNLINRRKWNQMDGAEQKAYEAKAKETAKKPLYRAWKGETFYDISRDTYLWAKQQGIKTAAMGASDAIKRIKSDIFQANYPTALQKAAELIKDANLAKRAEALRTLYNLQVGPRSRHLMKYVGELADEVLTKAERVLDPEDLEALKAAFAEMPL